MTGAPRQAQRGFTLVELMVSLVIFSFAIAGIMAVAVTMTRAYREQRRAIATENAARAPMDFIADAVRSASPGVTTGNVHDAYTCAAGAVAHLDNTGAPDELEIVYASGGIVTTTHSAFTSSSAAITVPADHVDQFAAGDYVLVTDSAQGTVAKVTGITGNNLDLAPITCATAFPTGGYPSGSILVRAQRARFTIDNLDGVPTLFMDPDGLAGPAEAEPVAEGVEDFQVAIGVDADASGDLLDNGGADEWAGNAPGDVLPAGAIRAVKVVLVARDTKEISGGSATFFRPAALNRSAATELDKYRRRVLTSTIEIRNLAGSPE